MSENIDQQEMLTLISSDGKKFSTPKKWILQSVTLTRLAENAKNEPIRVENVSSSILEKLIVYLEHHCNDPIVPENFECDDYSSWDVAFVNVSGETLMSLVTAAHDLKIPRLYQITCKIVANMIVGKSPAEIRRIYRIGREDFTPEEEEEYRRRYL